MLLFEIFLVLLYHDWVGCRLKDDPTLVRIDQSDMPKFTIDESLL
jgi:hypothetical protein